MFRRFRNYTQIGGKRGGIPADCVEVDWIEADNSGATASGGMKFWIDTGIVAGLNHRWEIGVCFLGFGSVAGCYGRAGDRFAFGRGSLGWGDWYFGLGSINTRTGYGNVYDSVYHDFVLDAKGGKWSVDDRSGALPSGTWYNYGGTIYLFARHSKATGIDKVESDSSKSRLYYSRLYESGKLIQNLVPVRRTTDGLGYMCDTLTGKLYGNAGTGAFVVGPDKREWVNPYITDGLIAMWDGEWNAGGGVHDASIGKAVNLLNPDESVSGAIGDDYWTLGAAARTLV